MKNKYLIDAGHGGVCFGFYLTNGKRSPDIFDGMIEQKQVGIYEGEFVRKVASRIADYSTDIEVLTPGPINVPLKKRVEYVNELHKRIPNLHLISLHTNAVEGGWNDDAKGHRIFTSTNASRKSNVLADVIDTEFIYGYGDVANIGDPQAETRKTANFDIIHDTTCPAVFCEMLFHTNRDEAKLAASEAGVYTYFTTLLNAIFEYDRV